VFSSLSAVAGTRTVAAILAVTVLKFMVARAERAMLGQIFVKVNVEFTRFGRVIC